MKEQAPVEISPDTQAQHDMAVDHMDSEYGPARATRVSADSVRGTKGYHEGGVAVQWKEEGNDKVTAHAINKNSLGEGADSDAESLYTTHTEHLEHNPLNVTRSYDPKVVRDVGSRDERGRLVGDPTKNEVYTHTFKNKDKAARLITGLAIKQINRSREQSKAADKAA